MADATYGLVVPFLDDDPKFAYGVEFGLLYARMREGSGEDVIEDYFLLANQDQILLTASRLGWDVVKVQSAVVTGWFRCRMRRRGGL